MSQITEGVRSLLAHPGVYQAWGSLVGADRARRTLVSEYLRPREGQRVLDIGCGPGTMLPYLPSVKYQGFDPSEAYIQEAKRRFGDRGSFTCSQVTAAAFEPWQSFDLIMAIGVVHHLGDDEASQLFGLAGRLLAPGARLVTFDGCYTEDQSRLTRHFLSRDRGRNIRTQEEYLRLAREIFSTTAAHLRHDLLRIPYTHLILECTRS